MIYTDPTEIREGTRLPQNLIQASKVLPGLEEATGADFLITNHSGNPSKDAITHSMNAEIVKRLWSSQPNVEIAKELSVPIPTIMHIKTFWLMCNNGVLVQRKTGSDLANSIIGGHLTQEVLAKMTVWTDKPWLLFVGNLKCAKDGSIVIDNFKINITHDQIQGALESWQIRGGYLTMLENDNLVYPWATRMTKKIDEWQKERIKFILPRIPKQILLPTEHEKAWWTTLATIPGIGPEKAKELGEWAGSLAAALMWLDDPEAETYENRPRGIASGILKKARDWINSGPNNKLTIIGYSKEE